MFFVFLFNLVLTVFKNNAITVAILNSTSICFCLSLDDEISD